MSDFYRRLYTTLPYNADADNDNNSTVKFENVSENLENNSVVIKIKPDFTQYTQGQVNESLLEYINTYVSINNNNQFICNPNLPALPVFPRTDPVTEVREAFGEAE